MSDEKYNPFEAYHDAIMPRRPRPTQPRVLKSEREAPMVLRGAEKEVAENHTLLRRYRRAKAFEYEQALKGPDAELYRRLHVALKALTIDNVDVLLEIVESYPALDPVMLSMIDDAIVRLRIRNGLSPIDDALPGEEPTVFQICRAKTRSD